MMNHYKGAAEMLQNNRPVAVETTVKGTEGLISEGLSRRLTDVSPVTDAKGRRSAGVTCLKDGDSTVITEPLLPRERLIVLGGGHIALPVCEIGAKCGFSVWVADDRPVFANKKRFPDADEVICDSFENAIKRIGIGPFDYVVIITRGHRYDADCLRAVIPGPQPAYLGMIGSRRRVSAQMVMLKEEGLDPDRLDRVCTPIGLNIGAVTPGEIAVSIMAEVIAHRRLAEYGDPDKFCNDSDIELGMLNYLAEDASPKAVATIIRTRGSSPRDAGAKMAVDPLGQITGSIGGGCGEAEVIREAVSIIGTGRYKLVTVDLTGDAAEDDGMACGGIMDILVEDFSQKEN